MTKITIAFLMLSFAFNSEKLCAQDGSLKVIAYYSGSADKVSDYEVEQLTHIIYCFSHLKGNQLDIDNANGDATIRQLVQLKERNPSLKVLLSLGGWGGCKTCSEIFSSHKNRVEFSKSVKRLLQKYHADGIDLDWEYPAIEGFPGHAFKPSDKQNFTQLIKQLRHSLGQQYEISFAAGGIKPYMDSSIEWKKVMPLVNNVNLMSYDLVNGYSLVTGHHTPLYSTPQNMLSVDWGVTQLLNFGVPKEKIVIGAAFYGRVWENVPDSNNGLYQSGKFKTSESIQKIDDLLKTDEYAYHWDTTAQAPYIYNASEKLFITYDNKKSVEKKTRYALDKGLGGIMFWELGLDYYKDGLLETIYNTKENYPGK